MKFFDFSAPETWDGIETTPKGALDDIFAEEPVSLTTFVKDKKFLNSDWDLSPIQTDLVQHMERVYLPELYPLMAKEWGGYWKDTLHVPMKNLITAEWAKGCVAGDTEVYDPMTGYWNRIDGISGEHEVIGTLQGNEDGDTNHESGQPYNAEHDTILIRKAGEPFVRGKGRMLKVTTRTGTEITVFEGHLFPAKNGVAYKPEWMAAGDLQGGMLVATPSYVPIAGVQHLNDEAMAAAISQAKIGYFPEAMYAANYGQIEYFLQALGKTRVTHSVAVGMKRLYLRLAIVATMRRVGSHYKVRPAQIQPVSEVYWDMVDTVEEAGEGEYWDMNVPEMGTYVANGFVNSNSGKDHTVRIGALRVAYLLLCLKSPQIYFGMPEQDSIHMLNVAANAPQAHRAFFAPMARAVKTGWFADKADPKRDTIMFDKNVEAVSGHSDAEAQEGLNIIFGVTDEIDAFKTKSELIGQGNKAREASTTAESILNMIESSASTRFPHSFKRVAISYPRYQGSTIQRLTKEAKADMAAHPADSVYYASGPYPTWEVNPLRKRSDFDAKYRADPAEAAAKYECKPFRSSAPYFRNPDIFSQSIDSESQPLTLDYELVERISNITGKPVKGWEPRYHFGPSLKPRQGAKYAIHADLAIKGDRAGVAMSHIERWEEHKVVRTEDDGTVSVHEEIRPVVRNDFTIYYEADIGETPSREIQIRWVRELVATLIGKGYHISLVTYDGFQSVDSMQLLNYQGIETNRVSTDRDPSIWKSLKDIASEGRLRMPYDELLMDELEALSDVNGKVDHPPAGSKDLADAFACSIVGALVLGGEESEDRAIVLSEDSIFDVGDFPEMPFGMTGSGFDMPLGLRGYGD